MADIKTPQEAIEYIKGNSKTKFDATVEVHINLNLDVKQSNIRYTTTLPNGTGKFVKVAAMASGKIDGADIQLTEADITKLENGTIKPKTDFDVLITEPKFMSKLAKIARILGPAGVMPNPKAGTVTEDVEEAVRLTKKGKVEIRTEPNAPIIHTIIGKVSFETEALAENLEEVLSSLRANKPAKVAPDWIKSVYLSSTMGPSVGVNF